MNRSRTNAPMWHPTAAGHLRRALLLELTMLLGAYVALAAHEAAQAGRNARGGRR